ncbi:hypothetical protein SDC9_187950 [bioreactor metagenome]|uniref:Uncharacterized protein n=1 Tax=bioreactor metagenome TaxID=1076179 RepID=A0A645HYN9_9ZZZZ
MQMMLQNLEQKKSQEQISGASDSLAKTYRLQENSEDLVENEVDSILALLTSSRAKKKKINPHSYLLRTLKTCCQSITDGILPQFYLNWTKQGMMQLGRCLTLKISESHKIGSVCSLSQVLEAEVDEKYYLSEEKTQQLLSKL